MGHWYFLQAEGLTPSRSADGGTEQVPWDPGARTACSGQGVSWGVPQEWFPSPCYLGPKINNSHSTSIFTWRPSLGTQRSVQDGAREGRGGWLPAPTWPPAGCRTPGQSLGLLEAPFLHLQ